MSSTVHVVFRKWEAIRNGGTSLFGTSSEIEKQKTVPGRHRNIGNLPISRQKTLPRTACSKRKFPHQKIPTSRKGREKWGTQELLSGRVVLAGDLQALHFRLQGGALEAEPTGGAVRSGERASSFPEHAEDVLPLGVIQTVIWRGGGGAAFGAQVRQRDMQRIAVA